MPNRYKPNFHDEPLAGYWEWDMTGTNRFNNPAMMESLGFAGDVEDHQALWLSSILPEDLEAVKQRVYLLLAKPGDKKPLVHEARCRHADGFIIHFLFTGHIQWKNDRAILISGSYINITRQKETEKELLLVKDFLSKTNEVAMVGGWHLDMATDEVTWTDLTRKIFGLPDDFIPDRCTASKFFKEGYDRESLHQGFRDAVEKGITYDLQLRVINTRGEQIWTRTIGTPEFEDGRCVRLYGIFQDITQQKENEEALVRAKEEAEAAVVAKSKFLSVMSHEIRTPMNAVIGFTNLLLQDPRSDQQEYLSVLKFSADNLMVIINDILDVNKIEAGKVEFEENDFDLKELLDNIHTAQQQAADEKDIKFTLDFDKAIPVMVLGDKVRLGQILNNLINNAIKFTQEGRVSLSCKLLGQDAKNISIYFEVKDTGIGVPADKQEHIFDVFSQASSSTTRQFGGTGLGLAISKRLVNLMGGNIGVNSAPGEGSTFYFELKFVRGKKYIIDSITDKPIISPPVLRGSRILLVEDNPVNVLVARRFLENWEMVCDVAENGKIAVDMVKDNPYHLVLMDMQMPVMDGYEATAAIREMGGKYLQLPIVALTASAMLDMKDKVIAGGMNDYISKPFKPSELYDKISRYIKGQ